MIKLEKHKKVRGAQRTVLVSSLVAAYIAGRSIRALAAELGRSYGFVHRLLADSGVALRPRGGHRLPQQRKAAAAESGAPRLPIEELSGGR
ncbi:helix-turn-helix domain-containing protein [Phytomonospora endophytica]|uniref:Transposase n=1 Tax=Phytomonospora endophytica TaxID=714109 RepID=A0A841FLQ2_9ACTN|nr:helix-turn-helix domain-containing protein [Phytomonospora endophytica]MBB6036905.1 transposase [Phytomonospora endophytica]